MSTVALAMWVVAPAEAALGALLVEVESHFARIRAHETLDARTLRGR